MASADVVAGKQEEETKGLGSLSHWKELSTAQSYLLVAARHFYRGIELLVVFEEESQDGASPSIPIWLVAARCIVP